MNLVLLEPEMPSNTGNIGRTALLTGSRLHLIRPLAFRLDDKQLRRSGMDYWKDVDLIVHDSYEEFLVYLGERRIWYATTKASRRYDEVQYKEDDFLMFGKESRGIDEEILRAHPERQIRVPMKNFGRSLNLANSVSIILYEALRQNNFFELE